MPVLEELASRRACSAWFSLLLKTTPSARSQHLAERVRGVSVQKQRLWETKAAAPSFPPWAQSLQEEGGILTKFHGDECYNAGDERIGCAATNLKKAS